MEEEGWVKREVALLPPALSSTVLANSNMKCADASLGWFGTVGMMRVLPLYLQTHKNTIKRYTFTPKITPSKVVHANPQ